MARAHRGRLECVAVANLVADLVALASQLYLRRRAGHRKSRHGTRCRDAAGDQILDGVATGVSVGLIFVRRKSAGISHGGASILMGGELYLRRGGQGPKISGSERVRSGGIRDRRWRIAGGEGVSVGLVQRLL